jgi:hypothetical protein
VTAPKSPATRIDSLFGAPDKIQTDEAQSLPGHGDLFGLVVTPDGKGFYCVEDDVNTLMEASQ